MKRETWTKQMAVILVAVIAFIGIPLKNSNLHAKTLLENSIDDCTVEESIDEAVFGRKSITLRGAMYFAGKSSRRDQACRKTTTVYSEVINFRAPLDVSVQNVTTNMGDNSDYVLDGCITPPGSKLAKGNCVPGKRASWNFDNMGLPKGIVLTKADADGMTYAQKHCAVTITNTRNVILRNISIENSPVSGICIGEGVFNVKLDNVGVVNTGNGGHGIVIMNGASENVIKGGSTLEQIKGDGIHIINADISAHNSLDATDRPIGANQTTAEGTANFVDPLAKADDFIMKGITGNFVQSNVPAFIKLSVLSSDEPGKFHIEGALVNDATVHVPFVIETIDQNLLVPSLQRLQVYATGLQAAGESGGQSAIFLTYVGKQSDCGGDDCGNGVIEGQDSTNSYNLNGIFKFTLNTNVFKERINQIRAAQVPPLPPIEAIREIALVPEMDNLTVGTSRQKVTLRSGNTKGIVDTEDGTSGNYSGGSSGGSSGASSTGFIHQGYATVNACLTQKSLGQLAPRGYDSDGDGLEDRDEDINGNCVCDPDENSCWDKPDSDGDGIPDKQETNGTVNPDRWDAANKRFVTAESFCIISAGGVTDPCNADEGDEAFNGAGKRSNARQDDSDGDGLSDGVEDRSRVFSPGRTAHYYIWGGVGNMPSYLNDKGERVECDLAEKSGIGAKYGIYVVKKDLSGTPHENTWMRNLDGTEGLMSLVCRNDSVADDKNFNGTYDSDNGETNAYNKNTHDSSYTDGECQGTKFNRATGDCELQCVKYEIFRGLPEEYVNESRTALKMTSVNGKEVPLIYTLKWQDIAQLCSDIDKDNIPDCVENETGQCSFDVTKNLNPYKKDSDGDGLMDGRVRRGVASDKCPFTPGEDCSRETVYEHRPVLAYFLDRDGDGLSDGEEDINLDGKPDLLKGMNKDDPAADNRKLTETDPLNTDTDGDTIDDYTEVNTWQRYTNAADDDTDHDGLPDNLEVKDYTAPLSGQKYNSTAGCDAFKPLAPGTNNLIQEGIDRGADSTRFGTDPANEDTDGDGVSDLTEVTGTLAGKINVGDLLSGLQTGFDLVSNPLNPDSDKDGVKDGEEYGADGVLNNYIESNPCDANTDGDSRNDLEEPIGCRSNPDERCTGGAAGSLLDSDLDGEPDSMEILLGTDLHNRDSDNDGLLDGEEDANHDGQITTGETDPRNPDMDGDQLKDGDEIKILHTNPFNKDTDGDGIEDGVEVKFNPYNKADTDPTNPDTDGDGLCDGNRTVQHGGPAGDVSCIRGEDLNVNGIVDEVPGHPNQFTETDPRNADSDSDGLNDKQEICNGGSCNIAANLGRATQGRSEGCFSVNGRQEGGPTSIFYLFGLLLVWNRVIVRRIRKTSSPL